MIVELSVDNLAIIERAEVAFGPGLTVLTGETGAGKSLLIDAIELALGARADSDLVRAGAPRALVNLTIDLTHDALTARKCADLGFAPEEDGCLYIQREVFAEGRSQARVNGRLAPINGLKGLGQLIVDLHGQHDHQSLMHPERHLGFLDEWIGEPAHHLREKVAEAHAQLGALERKLASLRTGRRERAQRVDLLEHQIAEIEALGPVAGEFEELEALLSRLNHAEKLAQAAGLALNLAYDGETAARDQLAAGVKALDDVARFDPGLSEVLEPLRSALAQLIDAGYALRDYTESVESDPARLEEVAGRLDALKRLRRKYGDDEAAILRYLELARTELDELADNASTVEDLEAEVSAARARLEGLARELTQVRLERAGAFSDQVAAQLRELAMAKAAFQVDRKSKPVDADGADSVEYLFSANLGEPPRPLAKIASGGELSRVMLALKTVLSGRAGVPSLIFDEVDAGLGGQAASVVGRKLEELARHHQVIVISHLPQIAGRAATHVRIEKVESQGRVATQIRHLGEAARVEEIARMLAGESLTEASLATAREMLGLA